MARIKDNERLRNAIQEIKSRVNIIDYARNVLGWPVYRDGDRCKSYLSDNVGNNALIFHEGWFWDFKAGTGGDVINLCALVKYDGDIGAAIRELSNDDDVIRDYANWREYTNNLTNKIAWYHQQLRECDIEYLRSRRINATTIERLKIGYDIREDRLIIPYYKNGYVAYYIGRDRSGNPDASKYKKAKLDGFNENIAWGLHTFTRQHRLEMRKVIAQSEQDSDDDGALIDPRYLDQITVITEGVFDAISFEQEGFRVLSPMGGSFSPDALKQVISLCKSSDEVFICFDSDNAGSNFQTKTAAIMLENGINFTCGHLTGFKDISDYYTAGGNLLNLVSKGEQGSKFLARSFKNKASLKSFLIERGAHMAIEDLTEFVSYLDAGLFSKAWINAVLKTVTKAPVDRDIADKVIQSHTLYFVPTQGFYEYESGVWKARPDEQIGGYVNLLLGKWVSGAKISSVVSILKTQTTTTKPFNREAIFNFHNGVLELETGKFKRHSPEYLSSVQVEYDYDAKADCPRFKRFVSEIMKEREPSMNLLQEMCGYILYEDCSLQKGFFLIGNGANGKSVLLNTITRVFGDDNVSNVEMSGLEEGFQRINLINSLVNISTETSSDVKGAETIFKQVITGDKIMASYKGKDYVNFKPRCVMISACNEYPHSKDKTDAFLRRICFIDFPCKFEGDNADRELEAKLANEVPGIFNWCYEGYKRLKKANKFTQTPEQLKMMKEYRQIQNPIEVFLDECIGKEPHEYERPAVYKLAQQWYKEAGLTRVPGRNTFLKDIQITAQRMDIPVNIYKRGKIWYMQFNMPEGPDYYDDILGAISIQQGIQWDYNPDNYNPENPDVDC